MLGHHSDSANFQLLSGPYGKQPIPDDGTGVPPDPLTWIHVAMAFGFIAFDAVFSLTLGLRVESSLIISSLRCIFQLALVASILQRVFETEDPWVVGFIALFLNLLGTIEVVANKSKRRHNAMFPTVFGGLLASTIPVSIIGTKFAMATQPFWTPIQYIPVMGMLTGNAISAVMVALSYVLRELHENRDKIEMYLAFGASRMEACRPIAVEALRLALTPIINQMSVIGIIAIPGMMTGAILGGSSVQQAAKLQMIIMFMISASSTLASMITTVLTLAYVVDGDHRVRCERIDDKKHVVWRKKDAAVEGVLNVLRAISRVVSWRGRAAHSRNSTAAAEDERRPLLS
ncbi:UPF0014-domain-containing protein [Pluteus cervinus]|uniref:UPF0014-domain-containing protein n=1 Tax=Pluteus cervinus TaxID=181527 RepID=A0ACD3AVF5_9AGAR|nr:UPF0014-domain-containing protein [Pluteus cervinus]